MIKVRKNKLYNFEKAALHDIPYHRQLFNMKLGQRKLLTLFEPPTKVLSCNHTGTQNSCCYRISE